MKNTTSKQPKATRLLLLTCTTLATCLFSFGNAAAQDCTGASNSVTIITGTDSSWNNNNNLVTGGTLNLASTTQTSGVITFNGGTLTGGTLSSNSYALGDNNNNLVTGSSNTTIGFNLIGDTGTIITGGTLTLANSNALTIGTIITGGTTTLLTGSNSYIGGTTLTGGTLTLANSNALTIGTIVSGSTVNLDSTTQTNVAITFNGGTLYGGTLTLGSISNGTDIINDGNHFIGKDNIEGINSGGTSWGGNFYLSGILKLVSYIGSSSENSIEGTHDSFAPGTAFFIDPNGTFDLQGSILTVSSLTFEDDSQMINGTFVIGNGDSATDQSSTEDCFSILRKTKFKNNTLETKETINLKETTNTISAFNFANGGKIINGTLIIDGTQTDQPTIKAEATATMPPSDLDNTGTITPNN